MEISNYLEKLRYGRKITQEEFVSGIVSLRQYQRYRYGECEIPYEKMEQFAERLGFSVNKLFSEFGQAKNKQLVKINQLYNAIVNHEEELGTSMMEELKDDIMIDGENETYFQHVVIVNDYQKGNIDKEQAIDQMLKLIDYPNVLKQKYFTDIEVLILSFLMEKMGKRDQNKILYRLTILFDDVSIMSGGSSIIYSLILMRMAKLYGIRKDYNQVIKLCKQGIQKGIEYKQYYLWEYFYYYIALSYFEMEDFKMFEDNLFKCFCVLQMEDLDDKIDKFTRLIKKDFKMNFFGFSLNYLKKQL
jgi:transcriptional regulator with XRE-family HTH domain